ARAREDFLVEDSAVWRRRPLHPALLVASYDKSRQVLPLYNEMLSALLNPVYRASKDRIQLAKAEESGLPSDYFCSIPSQAALDQMRNLRVKGDAKFIMPAGQQHSQLLQHCQQQHWRRAAVTAVGAAELDDQPSLEFDIAPGCSDESAATSCLRIPQADSAQQSRGRCRGGSSAALQQRQQQSPVLANHIIDSEFYCRSLTPNHSSLPSFGFGRGRGGSGGSG
uniref:HRDC domain-containing protein n=1 Tax=Macrostomum lignano TaxID=282301 RepID=A0A1I8FC16_9PLAT